MYSWDERLMMTAGSSVPAGYIVWWSTYGVMGLWSGHAPSNGLLWSVTLTAAFICATSVLYSTSRPPRPAKATGRHTGDGGFDGGSGCGCD
ncbi:hypothetical protein AB0P15_30020 [Streptomyces sp. NPDC087917]|uniref:hypothetical protein n=1 Tax=Streptomyces sp. NPDC087917 TaxID=3155060 RepID=UPI00342FB08D